MASRPRPNPFYVLLLVVSTFFAVTALGYLVAPYVQRQAIENPGHGPSEGSRALAAWFDRRGVAALSVELVAMFVLAILAMSLDRLFEPPKSTAPRPTSKVEASPTEPSSDA